MSPTVGAQASWGPAQLWSLLADTNCSVSAAVSRDGQRASPIVGGRFTACVSSRFSSDVACITVAYVQRSANKKRRDLVSRTSPPSNTDGGPIP